MKTENDDTKKLLTEEYWVWGLLPQDPSDIKRAIELMLELEKNHPDSIGLLDIRTWIAMAYFSLSETELSLEYHEMVREDLLGEPDVDKRVTNILMIDRQLASIYLHLGMNDLAKQRCEEGSSFLHLYQNQEDSASRTVFLCTYGYVLHEIGEAREAASVFKAGLKDSSRISDGYLKLHWTSFFRYLMGRSYAKDNQLKKGLKYISKVVISDLMPESREGVVITLLNVFFALDKYQDLVSAYNKYSQELSGASQKDMIYNMVGISHFHIDNLEEARKYINMSERENPTESYIIKDNKAYLEALDNEQ